MPSDTAIKTEGLTKDYSGFWRPDSPDPALKELNLSVPRGTVFGFLGPNGAGKTTTIRCLMDLIRPTRGKAWVLGESTDNIDVRAKVGYLPDSPSFGAYLSAQGFLQQCARLLKIPRDRRAGRLDEVLHAVRMQDHRTELLSTFSRGMLQRIGIAQALLNEPELLILDEPLVGLDPEGRKEVLQIMRERGDKGVCVFFCSHILSDVEALCDRVGILSRGELQAVGTTAHLLAAEGAELTIPAAHEALARELLITADSSSRGPDQTWILEFSDKETIRSLRDRDLPPDVSMRQRRERLETLFFRLTGTGPGAAERRGDTVQST